MRLSRPGIGPSVLLHALALYGLMHAGHSPRPGPLQATIVWFALEGLLPAAPNEEPRATAAPITGSENRPRAEGPASRSDRSARPTSRSERAARPTRPQPSEPAIAPAGAVPAARPPATVPSTSPAQDLVEARRRAAVDAVEEGARADAHRSFAFPGTIAEQRAFDESERLRSRERGLQPPLTVFDSPAKGRAGLAEEPSGPFGVHWVSDDCYVFREPLDRFVLPGLFVEPKTCTRRLARADLFVTAKPSYLMNDEERAAVDAEKERREVLRRPTTGAVMPLAKD